MLPNPQSITQNLIGDLRRLTVARPASFSSESVERIIFRSQALKRDHTQEFHVIQGICASLLGDRGSVETQFAQAAALGKNRFVIENKLLALSTVGDHAAAGLEAVEAIKDFDTDPKVLREIRDWLIQVGRIWDAKSLDARLTRLGSSINFGATEAIRILEEANVDQSIVNESVVRSRDFLIQKGFKFQEVYFATLGEDEANHNFVVFRFGLVESADTIYSLTDDFLDLLDEVKGSEKLDGVLNLTLAVADLEVTDEHKSGAAA